MQPRTRATASAILLFVVNLLGLGLGPLGVGVVSDILNTSSGLGEAAGVRWSLVIFVMLGFVSSLLFWKARQFIREGSVS